MSASQPELSTSVWQQLKNREITCEEALQLLIDEQGRVQIHGLDPDLTFRFFHDFPDPTQVPPVIPLLLWRGAYYLGSPVELAESEIQKIADRTHTRIYVIPVDQQSYRTWFRLQNLPDQNNIHGYTPLIDPLTGEVDEDIREMADLYLSQAESQSHRINAIVSGALQSRASDIHLEPTPDGLRVRYRVDGILRDITLLDLEVSRSVIVAGKVMSDMNIAESRIPQDGRIGRNYASAQDIRMDLDLRVSTLPCVGGEKIVIRLLQRDKEAFSDLHKLGFTPNSLKVYERWLQEPQGLIVLTGPTGSGKTSTLYTSLRKVATSAVNVITVEDPVEYVLPGLTQTQVRERAGMTFAAGLRAILRQDPDIIMVGEVRDRETAETVIRAALTGHLVFTTMHTNDAVSTIPRLRDLGQDPGLVSDALIGIAAQRLVRRVCPMCAKPYQPTREELQVLRLKPEVLEVGQWKKGQGCQKCFNTGYYGRQALMELLEIDDKVRVLIYEGNMTELQYYLKQKGFTSFRRAAIEKVLNGDSTIEEVARVLPRSALEGSIIDSDELGLEDVLPLIGNSSQRGSKNGHHSD